MIKAFAAPGSLFLADCFISDREFDLVNRQYKSSNYKRLYKNYLDHHFHFLSDQLAVVNNVSTPAPSTIKQQLVFYASQADYYKTDTLLVKSVLDFTVGETTYDFTSIELVSESPSADNLNVSAALEALTTTSTVSYTNFLSTSIAVLLISTSLNVATGAGTLLTPSLNLTTSANLLSLTESFCTNSSTNTNMLLSFFFH